MSAGRTQAEPILVPDWREPRLLPFRPDLAAQHIRSSAAIPIGARHMQPAYGVMWLHSAEPRIFTDDGVSAGTLIGKTIREAGMPEREASGKELVLHLAWRTGREQAFEFVAQTALGDRHFQTRIVPEIGPDRRVQSLLSITRDMTDQRRAEAERTRLYPALVQQQAQLAELLARLGQDRARERHLTTEAFAFQAAQLTERQLDVLRLLVKGWTNRQIAAALHVSAGTVKNQVARIMAILGASHRTEAAVRSVAIGLVPPE